MTEQDDFTKIRVGDFTVGIMGLKAALEEVVKTNFSSDRGVAEYLLKQLKAKNYIPPPAEAEYAQAFLREYRKYKGEEVEVEKYRGLEVKILGPGCPNCDKLEHMVYKVMADEAMAGNVEHIKDLREIASYGLVATPALMINGAIKASGRLPRERQLRKWLQQAIES